MQNKYCWLSNKDIELKFTYHQHQGQESLGDYLPTLHTGAIHKHAKSCYLNNKGLPRTLPRAAMPSSLQECAETLEGPYYHRVSLPRIPEYHRLDQQTQLDDATDDVANTVWHSQILNDS